MYSHSLSASIKSMSLREVTDDIPAARSSEHSKNPARIGGLFATFCDVGEQTNAIQNSERRGAGSLPFAVAFQESIQDFCERFGSRYEYFGTPRIASMNDINYMPYYEKLTQALKDAGDLYTIQDILAAIAESRMQSFAEGNTWAITEVNTFPNRKIVTIAYVIGDLKDAEILHDRVIEFAKSIGATMVKAFGRVGWAKDAEKNGWRVAGQVYHKEL